MWHDVYPYFWNKNNQTNFQTISPLIDVAFLNILLKGAIRFLYSYLQIMNHGETFCESSKKEVEKKLSVYEIEITCVVTVASNALFDNQPM